jgi:hypothetical protein
MRQVLGISARSALFSGTVPIILSGIERAAGGWLA